MLCPVDFIPTVPTVDESAVHGRLFAFQWGTFPNSKLHVWQSCCMPFVYFFHVFPYFECLFVDLLTCQPPGPGSIIKHLEHSTLLMWHALSRDPPSCTPTKRTGDGTAHRGNRQEPGHEIRQCERWQRVASDSRVRKSRELCGTPVCFWQAMASSLAAEDTAEGCRPAYLLLIHLVWLQGNGFVPSSWLWVHWNASHSSAWSIMVQSSSCSYWTFKHLTFNLCLPVNLSSFTSQVSATCQGSYLGHMRRYRWETPFDKSSRPYTLIYSAMKGSHFQLFEVQLETHQKS